MLVLKKIHLLVIWAQGEPTFWHFRFDVFEIEDVMTIQHSVPTLPFILSVWRFLP